jgi:hypothetical protein
VLFAKAHKNFEAFKKRFGKYDSAQIRDLDQFDWWTVLRSLGFTTQELQQRDLMDSIGSRARNRR